MNDNSDILKRLNTIEQMITEQNLLQKEMLTPEEAAHYLNISRSYLYKMTSRRMIPHYCPNGKKLFFKRTEIDQWLQSNRKKTSREIESEANSFVTKSHRI